MTCLHSSRCCWCWLLLCIAAVPAFALDASDAATNDYSEARAITYAKLAGAAYCNAKDLEAWTCGVKCFEGVHSIKVCPGYSTQGYVGLDGSSCFAAFEGTNAAASTFQDAFTYHASFHGAVVHNGFLNEWKSLSSCIEASLADLGCGTTIHPVGITGHSLGAAVASLAAMDLRSANFSIRDVYTFGSPRIGNQGFVDAFDQEFEGRFFRVTHGPDPFTDMPAGPFYRHLEPEVYYKGDLAEGYRICIREEDKLCSAQNQPNFYHVAEGSYTRFHHNYMGVATTQAQCRSHEGCDDDIAASWCNAMIPCNKDARGTEVYCTSSWSMGKCHCNPGFCPLNGFCVPRSEFEAKRNATPVVEANPQGMTVIAGSAPSTSPALEHAGGTRAWHTPFAVAGTCGIAMGAAIILYIAEMRRRRAKPEAQVSLLG